MLSAASISAIDSLTLRLMPSLGVLATNTPPERPRPTRIRCEADSSRSASRNVGRLTPNSSAISCSVPIRWPGSSRCSSSQRRIWVAISSLAPVAERRYSGRGRSGDVAIAAMVRNLEASAVKVQTFCSTVTCVTSPTVRDATFDVLRRLELTTIFSNPGSTEVPFLAGLPGGPAFRARRCTRARSSRWRPGTRSAAARPSLALLHSTPGLGNAVAALATARSNRAPPWS